MKGERFVEGEGVRSERLLKINWILLSQWLHSNNT